jgi:hypothetical protein
MYFTAVFNYVLNIDIHQRSVMPLKVHEDANVKKKACNIDIEEEITGFNSVACGVAFPARCFEYGVGPHPS